ncbi:NADH:flavin oxidoreductase/NADH oxidase [Demequina sp. SYSU T00039]|uniref:NADH:flavin oxidoreductase/NADH oxidase n=1 Tax=Demequina lignilytica TaxID=3051663 RepID=A0AAW7M4I6_9MICO|nr:MULTISPECIES: NADH:flavin oxidoreductase/NADH oxidase [unclassified Demequina]MDN4479283.1 NADH:flavin oxidoreductase/NADH oxidase [Demequina sp. SYSU T00039-1]MDN4488742.1 NADH:flavin oxidoreductase/NADH oxidase [Demequina sp. SYSU T00039]
MPSALFSPIDLRGATARNRLWVSPLCQYSCEHQDGVPDDWHLVHLGSFARGGAGLVMSEATAVTADGRISPWDTGIWNDEQRDAWARIVAFIHGQGALAAIQLAHAGRKASTYREWSGTGSVPAAEGGWTTVAPSAIAFPGYEPPVALTDEQILEVVDAFGAAARRSLDAGFDVLEVHAAHGYLLHQFLSPLSNTRDDRWGGALVGRARLLLHVVRRVREVAGPSVPVLVRISATDWKEPEGWTLDDSVTVARWLREAGADLVDTSTGGLVPAEIPVGPGYQVPHAAAVRDRGGIAAAAVGLIVDARQADELVASGRADAVFAGREFMRDPHFPLRAAHELGETLDYWPPQYTRAGFRSRPEVTSAED